MNYIDPNSPLVTQPDKISLVTLKDVEDRREKLCALVWSGESLDKFGSLNLIQRDVDDRINYGPIQNEEGNLRRIDWWAYRFAAWPATSFMYRFIPYESNGRMFIYHCGHDGGWEDEDVSANAHGVKPGLVIPHLIKEGYTVWALCMPCYGPNKTADYPDHNSVFDSVKNPMASFITPVMAILSEESGHYKDVSMIGLSGGGWTTTVCAALDSRIIRSFPVAGSVPIYLRPGHEALGDAEQVWEPFYSIANYTELYVMASIGTGRLHFQVLNEKDPECFAGRRFMNWVPQVQQAVALLGLGQYRFLLDCWNTTHSISPSSLTWMLDQT